MVELLSDNYLFLYFIVLFLFLKPQQLKDNQKILLVYILSILVDYLSKIYTINNISISLLTLFLTQEYFTNSTFKTQIMHKFHHKLIDFFYIMFTEYALLHYFLIIFLNTDITKKYFSNYITSELIILCQLLVFIKLISKLSYMSWELKSLDDMKKEIESLSLIHEFDVDMHEPKFEQVTIMEDKFYYKRKKVSTIFSKEYALNIAAEKLGIIKSKISSKSLYTKKTSHINFNKLRGFSTIEAQLIRSIGIKSGYDSRYCNIIKRKIFEVLYVTLLLDNLHKNYQRYKYKNTEYYKEYLLYVYLHKARIHIKRKNYIGLHSLYGRDVKLLNPEEIFIGVLAFSKYNLNVDKIKKINKYYGFNYSEELLTEIFNKIK